MVSERKGDDRKNYSGSGAIAPPACLIEKEDMEKVRKKVEGVWIMSRS